MVIAADIHRAVLEVMDEAQELLDRLVIGLAALLGGSQFGGTQGAGL